MRTDRELTALFAGAIADEAPDPTFLDELFEVLVGEVDSLGLRRAEPVSGGPVSSRIRQLAPRGRPGTRAAFELPLAIAATVVIAVLAIAVTFRPQFGPTPTATPSPSLPPTPGPTWQITPSTTFSTFVSTTYGYRVGYPSNWRTTESPGRLDPNVYPYDFSGGVDYLSATSPNVLDPGLIIAGPRLTKPTTLAGWMANIAQLQATTLACGPPDATEPATVAGLPAQIDTWQACPEYILWAGFVRGDVAYHVLVIDQFADANPALQEQDHAMFLRILTSFAFTGPVETFGPSPAPSAPTVSSTPAPSR